MILFFGLGMIPKPTEDTVTKLLAEELENCGVKVEVFPVISTPGGVRKPDIWCVNAGAYPIEAKFREGDYLKAIAKVQNDYLRWYDLIGVKGGFAILYPEELARPMPLKLVREIAQRLRFKAVAMFPPKDKRNFSVYEGTLREVAKFLAEHVLTPPEYAEPSMDWIIKALRDAASSITLTLKYLSGKDLEALFGGKDVFKNVLQYEEGKYPIEALRLASAYLLINQLLFYHILSRRKSDLFKEIDADHIEKPEDLNRYFKRVLDINYRTIFSYDVASRIPPALVNYVKDAINVIKGLSPEKVGGDLLGTIFHDLVPFEVRKNVAAFYTNVLAAELLAWLSIDEPDVKVADLAVGSGGLLVAAYRRKRHLLESRGERFTQEDHRRFVEDELLGIDVMPFAANVAACHLALQSPEYFTNKVNIAVWDSTELEPDRVIPSIAGLRFVFKGQVGLESFLKPEERVKGVVSLRGEVPKEIKLEKYDVVIMNPPFTRQERIPKEYKKLLNERFEDYLDYLHGQLGYYGYFIMLADKFLKDHGRMALVLPATVLRIKSCEGIRRLWAKRYHVEHIITTWHRSAFSESVRFREILLIAKKGLTKDDKVSITVLKKLPKTPGDVREIADLIKKTKREWKDDKIMIKVYNYSKLRSYTKNWFRWISVSDLSLIDLMEDLLRADILVPLSEIAEAQRIDLEHLKFRDFSGFILHDRSRVQKAIDVWVADRVDDGRLIAKHIKLGWKAHIPLKALGRGLRRLSYVNTMDVTDNADYLILNWFDSIEDIARPLLTTKELKQFNEDIIDSWKRKFNRRKCHIVLGRRFDISATGSTLVSFYSDHPIVGTDHFWCIKGPQNNEAKTLCLWMNSTINLLQLFISRKETRGAWMQIDDYVLSDLKMPNYHTLNKRQRKDLIRLFSQVSYIQFPSILDQLINKHPARKAIDKIWLGILNYRGDVDALLDRLYNSLAYEITLLKRMMAEKT